MHLLFTKLGGIAKGVVFTEKQDSANQSFI